MKTRNKEKLNKYHQCDYESSRPDHLKTHMKKHVVEMIFENRQDQRFEFLLISFFSCYEV